MILYPAVDILDGRAVRLRQGDFDDATVYDSSPLDAARSWVEEGAGFLHVVDLDGARSGEPANLEQVRQITADLNVPVQVGGGLRSVESVRAALDSGVERVVLGTAALRDQEFLDDCLGFCRDRLIVSVDVSGGRVAVDGWQEVTGGEPEAVLESLMARGVRSFVYSNVDRDGMLEGPDLDEVRRIAGVIRGRFLYAGGIGSLADLEALAGLRQVNLGGVIVGKALYERRFTVREGQEALRA